MTGAKLAYVLRLLDLERWWPRMSPGAVELLTRCGSKLEQMCLVALVYAMDQRRHRRGIGPQAVASMAPGMWTFLEPWAAFPDGGPGRLWIEPQAMRQDRRVDFLIWIDAEPALIVEVDGYAHHRHRRRDDRRRDQADNLPTLRFYEETDSPLDWPARILDADQAAPCSHCGVPILGLHSCPIF